MSFQVSKEWILAQAIEEEGFDVTAGRAVARFNVASNLSPPEAIVAVKRKEILTRARELFATSPNWVTLFREVLGVQGVARMIFSSEEEFAAFEGSPEFREIQAMIARRRELGDETRTLSTCAIPTWSPVAAEPQISGNTEP